MIESDGKALWCAVIHQALTDATTKLSPKLYQRLEQIRSREWFTIPNRDFEVVCALAGIEPDRLRAIAAPLIEAAKQKDRPRPQRKQRTLRSRHTPGVGHDLSKIAPDRLSPVAHGLS